MKKLGLIIVCLLTAGILGCACHQRDDHTISPTDAKIHEAYFSYLENGKWKKALGLATAIVDMGEEKKLKITLPYDAKGRLMLTEEGDQIQDYSINKKKEIEIDLGEMEEERSRMVGFSLVTSNYGVSTGRLHIVGNLNVKDPMSVDFTCPRMHNEGLVGWCTRPYSNLTLKVNIEDDFTGKMRTSVTGNCRTDNLEYNIAGSGMIPIEVYPTGLGICNINIQIRQNYQGSSWGIAKAKIINANFYDERYVHLLPPLIQKRERNGYLLIAQGVYRSYLLNGTVKRAKHPTIKFNDGNYIFGVVWDRNGRVNWVEKNLTEQ